MAPNGHFEVYDSGSRVLYSENGFDSQKRAHILEFLDGQSMCVVLTVMDPETALLARKSALIKLRPGTEEGGMDCLALQHLRFLYRNLQSPISLAIKVEAGKEKLKYLLQNTSCFTSANCFRSRCN